MITKKMGVALALAAEAHQGQFRKGTAIPYIAHPMAVSAIAIEYGADEDQAIAALLHDAVEDGGSHYINIIEKTFGPRVIDIILGCTDGLPDSLGNKKPWVLRKKRYIEHLKNANSDITLVSAADKLHNIRSIHKDLNQIGLILFDRFAASIDDTLWYYESLTDIFNSKKSPMAQEMAFLLKSIKNIIQMSAKNE